MATILFNEIRFPLTNLLDLIDMGEIGLPEIQRQFVWKNTKVRDLFDSMYRGFPVGYLLFWANGMAENHKKIGTDQKQRIARLLVVDGQQRLTSLYAVIKGVPVIRENYKKEKIQIAFRPIDERFEVADAAIKKNPDFIPDISRLWSKEINQFDFINEFLDQLKKNGEIPKEEKESLAKAINRLYEIKNYPFTVMELLQNVDEEHVAEIFVRINSKGTVLKQADFILTLMSVFWDEGRTQLEEFCKQSRTPAKGSPFNYFIQPDADQILRVNVGLAFRRARLKYAYLILRGKDLETEQFSDEKRDQQFAILKEAQNFVLHLQNWQDFLRALLRAGFKSGTMITSQMAILYSQIFYLIGKRDFQVEAFKLRNVIARWFFMTALTGRYTGSPETDMEKDLAGLRSISTADEFVDYLDKIIADVFTEDYWNITLPNELATSSGRSPSMFAYYAALNLLNAKVLFSEMKVAELLDPATKGTRSAIERHHLFPKGFLAKQGITEIRDTNQIANFALVEWADNIDISDKSPAKYLPKYLQRFSKSEIKKMYKWHALPENWETMDYKEFLAERRLRMAQVIREGFECLKK